jgi:hypothetical protein
MVGKLVGLTVALTADTMVYLLAETMVGLTVARKVGK